MKILMVRKNYDLKLGIRMTENIFSGKAINEKAPPKKIE